MATAATISFATACEMLDPLKAMHELRGRTVDIDLVHPLRFEENAWRVDLILEGGDITWGPIVMRYRLGADLEWVRLLP